MSSLRNSINRREHRERAQPASRVQKFGLLEKHKDYVLRARDYHRKQDRLNALRNRARNRNDDEFNHGMINAQTKVCGCSMIYDIISCLRMEFII
jgi:U3 small nucleolar RNA-associated protein 11